MKTAVYFAFSATLFFSTKASAQLASQRPLPSFTKQKITVPQTNAASVTATDLPSQRSQFPEVRNGNQSQAKRRLSLANKQGGSLPSKSKVPIGQLGKPPKKK